MSNAAINPAVTTTPDNHSPGADAGHGAHAHDPHLAHHFDTPEQQYISAKLGMWIFLGTELLMFGGLFCGYSVYRHNHYEVFAFAHQFLDKWLGAVNTLVLITSSLTMAWAVRSSQLGHQTSLRWLMGVTIIGGYIFLGIKTVEYHKKWEHVLFIGPHNQFREGDKYIKPDEIGKTEEGEKEKEELTKQLANAARKTQAASAAPLPTTQSILPTNPVDAQRFSPVDPNAGGTNAALIRPLFPEMQGLAPYVPPEPAGEVPLAQMAPTDVKRLYTFFAVYFFMTGLHGLHVVIGMSLIAWVLLRSLGPKNVAWGVPLIPASIGVFLAVVGLIIRGGAGTGLVITGLIVAVLSVIWALLWVPRRRNLSGESEFGPSYFTPVDLVGLYWHLVDLIWIFLFPLLYLIH